MKDTIIGKYKILDEIGRGGMGIVYKGKHQELNMPVAIKTLPIELTHDQEYLERIENEAQILAQFTHPCIVYIHDRERKDDAVYLIMEYVPGITVADRLRKDGPFEVKEAARIIIRVASALEHAHKKGVIHRDIKPSNIMIRDDDAVKVTDFGIAKSSEGSDITRIRWTPGTRDYMSPEQAQGYGDIDGRSDMYSLGIVFYLMLTGKFPPHPLPERLPFVQPRYEKIIRKCLAEDRAERYPTASDLVLALEEAEKQYAVPQKRKKSGKGSRKKIPVITGAVFVALVVAMIVWQFDTIKGYIDDTLLDTKLKEIQPVQIAKKPPTPLVPKEEKPPPSQFAGKEPPPALSTKETSQTLNDVQDELPPATIDKEGPIQSKGEAYREDSSPREGIDTPAVLGAEIQPSGIQPSAGGALRSSVERQNDIFSILGNRPAINNPSDVRRIFALRIGFLENTGGRSEAALSVRAFLEQMNMVRIVEQGGCDLLITMNFSALDISLTLHSNLFGDEKIDSHQESYYYTSDQQLFASLEKIIQRYYCFNILRSMELLNTVGDGYSATVVLNGGSNGMFNVGDTIDICLNASREAYTMLLSVNSEGLYMLFPQTREEYVPQKTGKPFCSGPMEIFPPTGNELVVAILLSDKTLLPIDRYLAGDDQVIIEPASWFYDLNKSDNAAEYCEWVFAQLYNALPDKYATNSQFIKTYN